MLGEFEFPDSDKKDGKWSSIDWNMYMNLTKPAVAPKAWKAPRTDKSRGDQMDDTWVELKPTVNLRTILQGLLAGAVLGQDGKLLMVTTFLEACGEAM